MKTFLLSLATAALTFTSIATAQSITVTPQQLNFNVQTGVSNSASQVVTVAPNSTTSNSIAFIVNTQTSPWLLVQGTTGGIINNIPPTGVALSVSVNTQGLAPGQTYNGSFTVQLVSTPGSPVTVNVNLIVGGASTLSASPSTLFFTAVQGAQIATPGSQNVTLSSTSGNLAFTLTSQTQNGGNWLSVNSTGGIVGSSSGTFSVSAVPSGLAPGTYTGTITAASNPAGNLTQIPVTLTVNATSVLSVSPTSLGAFLYQTGGALPATQSLSLSTNGGTIPFTVGVTPAAPWLVVNPLGGTASGTPTAITLTATPTGLTPGTYSTSLNITPLNGAPLPAIPVTLVVSNNPLLQANPAQVTFTSAFAGPGPADQILNVTSVGGQVPFFVSTDVTWLTATSSSIASPAQVTLHVNPTGLTVGSLTGKLTLRPTNGDNYSIIIPVTYTITNPIQVVAVPASLLFSFQTNQSAPPSQALQIRGTGQPVPVSVTTTTTSCGTTWLTATTSQVTTPVTITVSAATAGMIPGICSGAISVSYLGSTAPLVVPVTVAVSAAAELSISIPVGFGSETVQQSAAGTGAIARTISLTSTDPATQVAFIASGTTNTAGGWLAVGPGFGSTPTNLVVSILPGGLAPGTYTGQVSISSPSLPTALPGQTFVLPVTVTVNPSITVGVAPPALSFTQTQGAAVPKTQSLTLTSAGGTASYTATISQITGGDWLDVNPSSGNANGDVTVGVKPNFLPANTTAYTAQIVLAFQNSATPPITVPVSLMVIAPLNLTLSPSSLSFNYQIGNLNPTPQKLAVSSTTPVLFTVTSTSSPAGWLVVDANSATTPRDLNISINPQGLAVGAYNGSISITTPGSAAPVVANVTLNVAAASAPQLGAIINAASSQAGSIAPGELITIKGTTLGPVSPTNGGLFTVNSTGGVDSRLQGVRVIFDNIPGTPIFVSATQINVNAPWEIAGRITVNVTVEYNGVTSTPVGLRVDNTSPAIFTLNTTGSGQAAVLNQDGSVNGALSATLRPATPNSVIAVYMTGAGQTSPVGITGSVSPSNQLLRITAPVTATIGGQNANVEFIGAAPGLITGVFQVNLRTPVGIVGNTLPLSISINGVATPAGPTIAVQ